MWGIQLGRLVRLGLLVATLVAAGACAPGAAADPPRVALVIGNGGYPAAPLAHAVSDARDVAAAFRASGYEVELLENVDQDRMLAAMEGLLFRGLDGTRVFYYAGHGIEKNGRNYLLPIGVRMPLPEDLNRHAVDVTQFVERLGRDTTTINVVVLDACRIPGRPTRGPNRGVGSGFRPMPAPRGTLIAYSTAAGTLARDGVFTRHLVRELPAPGVPVEEVFKRVRAAVLQATGNKQQPWEASSLIGPVCFVPSELGECPAPVYSQFPTRMNGAQK
jgi:uncharacterized caspase-like protein